MRVQYALELLNRLSKARLLLGQGLDDFDAENAELVNVRKERRALAERMQWLPANESEFAARDWYDVWLPLLAPSVETMKLGQAATTPVQWATFLRKVRSELAMPDASHTLELLAQLSHQTNFSIGCYCESEARCHRSVLRALLVEKGAQVLD